MPLFRIGSNIRQFEKLSDTLAMILPVLVEDLMALLRLKDVCYFVLAILSSFVIYILAINYL